MAYIVEFQVDDDPNPHWVFFSSTLTYRLADGTTLPIQQEAAWCAQCRSFVGVEVIPSGEELHALLRELQTPTSTHYFICGSESGIQAWIAELWVRLRWRETRHSPARCLICGSTEIEAVRVGADRSCVVNGKRLTEISQGFADTADWVAEYTAEGAVISKRE